MDILCSIVIPHYNNTERLLHCLKNLNSQSIARDKYEIILVDNGTQDFNEENISNFVNKIIVYKEHQDPYNCRNIGIREATSETIVLLDAKCIPENDWLQSGLKCLEETRSDIIGGHFNFEMDTRDFYQVTYSLIYLDTFHLHKLNLGYPTGNLILKKKIFNSIGYFEENRRSGQDIFWTRKAITMGFKHSYCSSMKVYYPAKLKKEILSSAYRDGKAIKVELYKNRSSLLRTLIRYLFPMRYSIITAKIRRKKMDLNTFEFLKIYLISWRINLMNFKGILS